MLRALLLCVLLAACSAADLEERRADPLLFAPEDIGTARSVVIGIPGALTSIRVLVPMERYRTPERTIAYYRLPGYDDHPAAAPFSIDGAADRLARFIEEGAFEQVYFVGHSTGAAISMETAKILRETMPETRISIAGIATTLPAPQPLLAGWRGARGTVSAAYRARTLNPREVWLEYYRRISYGPDVAVHAEIAKASDALIAANDDRIQLPERGLGRRHFAAAFTWGNVEPERLEGVDMTFWHGGVDPVFPAKQVRRFVARLPEANLRILDDHGHVILLTYPPVWNEIADLWGF